VNPLAYKSAARAQPSPIVVAAYSLALAGAALATVLSVVFGLIVLSGSLNFDEPVVPSIWRRCFRAAPFFAFAALAMVPFRWTSRGPAFWIRFILLISPVALLSMRLVQSVFAARAGRADPAIVPASIAFLALALAPACALILSRVLNAPLQSEKTPG
jgi:hypothetical protein